jgi:hypothetical protein
MSVYVQGAVTPAGIAGVIPNEVFGIAINWFAPRVPLLFRLPKVPDGSPIYQMVGHKYRPRTTTLGAAITSSGATSIVLADNTSFMQGDVLQLASGEHVEIVADPNSDGVTITVNRGVETTTAATQSNGSAVRLVGNSRTGAENSPKAIQSVLTSVTQYAQTFQHPYTIGGGVLSNTLFPVAPGARTPLDQYKMDAMQNALDDISQSSYFGVGESAANATSGRAKQVGLRTLITTNKVTSPSDASAYKSTSFQRDFLTAPRKSGGYPNIVVLASNWMDAFATWAIPLQKIVQGQTTFGADITAFAAPFLGDVLIIEDSLLPNYTGFSLTEQECRFRFKRPLVDEPYGKIGDTAQGHMIAEGSIELDNEFHHAWVEGVTAFSN